MCWTQNVNTVASKESATAFSFILLFYFAKLVLYLLRCALFVKLCLVLSGLLSPLLLLSSALSASCALHHFVCFTEVFKASLLVLHLMLTLNCTPEAFVSKLWNSDLRLKLLQQSL